MFAISRKCAKPAHLARSILSKIRWSIRARGLPPWGCLFLLPLNMTHDVSGRPVRSTVTRSDLISSGRGSL